MQGLADGYFVLPYTIGHYLAQTPAGFSDTSRPEFEASQKHVKETMEKLLAVNGPNPRSCDVFHRELGYLMLDKVGMARDKEGLEYAIKRIREIRADFWENVSVPGSIETINPALERNPASCRVLRVC